MRRVFLLHGGIMDKIRKVFMDKVFLKSLLIIAFPIALQNLITSSLNMIDTLMISSLGQTSIAAVGLANQLFFFYILITFGINSGSSIFISQYYGKNDIVSIRTILGLALTLSIGVALIFNVIALFFPEFIMGIFIDEAQVIAQGSQYLRLISFSYLATAISFSLGIALRSTGRPNVPMVASAISFVTNTLLNYIMIFGKLGFPALGVQGAALATLIARLVEAFMLIYAIYSAKGILAASLKELLGWQKDFVFKYLKTTYPVIMTEAGWALGQVMYNIAYARIGEQATAAVQLTITIQNIFFVVVRGLANASTVMIGNKIGSEGEEAAYKDAFKFMTLATILGVVLGLIMFLTPDITLMFFTGIDHALYEVARNMLVVMAITFPIRVFTTVGIVGILRGGGDTAFTMKLDLSTVWLVGVPLAFIGVYLFKLPVYYLYLLISVEELFKLVFMIPRMRSKKWIKNIT